jgi:hypothetical protein
MKNYPQRVWRRVRDLLPVKGFHCDRPIVILQSDDWGRVGVRDQEGLEQLRSAGLALGERPYDLYSLETAEDLAALSNLLKRHRDSVGQPPSIGMNFMVSNLDFGKMAADPLNPIHLLPLAEGLPEGWNRSNLVDGYRSGISDGVFKAALHGSTHFCRPAVERSLEDNSDRRKLLHTLWQAATPYIHWRMPWIGYEYWDPEQPEDQRFLPAETQKELIGHSVGAFAKLFSTLARSACAPGYRANDDTHRAWAQHGIRVAQNGPGQSLPPHFDRYEILHLSRTIEFEPATDPSFWVETGLRQASDCFARGVPAIVSVHSINFHSTIRDFRSPTLQALEEFLAALESKHANLLYLHDEDLYDLVTKGRYSAQPGNVQVKVTQKTFTKAAAARGRNT